MMDPDPLSERVIAAVFTVSNTLGCGFFEKVYENALAHELRKAGLKARQQAPIQVHYDSRIVGVYFADLLVESRLVLELKAIRALDDIHFAQCLNYLKATGLPACLLINFGSPRVEIRRIVNKFMPT